MSEARLKYRELAPEGLAKMTALEHYLNSGRAWRLRCWGWCGCGLR
jgi:hypothetical protein